MKRREVIFVVTLFAVVLFALAFGLALVERYTRFSPEVVYHLFVRRPASQRWPRKGQPWKAWWWALVAEARRAETARWRKEHDEDEAHHRAAAGNGVAN